MSKRMIIRVGLVVAVVFVLGLLVGCNTNETDPRKGGLFGYNPKAYEERLDQKKGELKEQEQKNAEAKKKSAALEAQTEAQRAERDALMAKVDQADRDVADLTASVNAVQAKSEAAKKKKWQLQTRLKLVKSQLKDIRSGSGGDTAAKQAELNKLQTKIDQLLSEAEKLSDM